MILAQQGGWDEALMVCAPLVVFLVVTRRRYRPGAKTGASPAG